MLIRPKVALAIGLSCATSAALAGGAMAHGGGDRGDRGRTGLEVKVRGLVTELTTASPTTAASITVSPGGTLAPWTCALSEGADTTGVVVNTTTVKMKCRVRDGVLTAKRVHESEDTTGKVKVSATGLVTAFTPADAGTPPPPTPPETPGDSTLLDASDTPADPTPPSTGTPGSITIDPGTDLPLVTCAVTEDTRLRGTPAVGIDLAKVACRSRDDALVAKKVKIKGQGKKLGSRSGRHGGGRHKGDR